MRTVSFYDAKTGVFSGVNLLASDESAIELNTPPGHAAIDGHYDYFTKRVDIDNPSFVEWEDGEIKPVFSVVEYQPPQPSPDHEWNDDTKRWRLNTDAATKIERRSVARARIAQLEESQHAHVREHCIGIAGAAAELQKIHDEIITLQKDA